MPAQALAKVGVELIVANLAKFAGDIGTASKKVSGLGDTLKNLVKWNTPIEKLFSGVSNAMGKLARSGVRILEIALGNLLAMAIQKVIGLFKELIAGVIETGDTFQKLQVRLNRFNLNDLTESGIEYNKALAESIELTKEQIRWTLDLGGRTPYDASDIADIYSLARAYGYAADTAKQLTEDVLNFTAGMGLTEVHARRIIENFGQMVFQGKITGTELRDLARGGFVPTTKVLAIMAEQMGITTEELNKLRKAGDTDPEFFLRAFGLMVGEDFIGASEAMLDVLTRSVDNVKGIFTDLGGWFVTTPVFKTISQKINDMVSGFYVDDKLREDFVSSFERIGKSLSRIIDKLLGVGGGENIADAIIKGLDRLATWLENNEDNIVNFIENTLGGIATVAQNIYTWITETAMPALDRFGEWWDEHGQTVIDLVTTLGWAILIANVGFLLFKASVGSMLLVMNPLNWILVVVIGSLALFVAAVRTVATWIENTVGTVDEFTASIEENKKKFLDWSDRTDQAIQEWSDNVQAKIDEFIKNMKETVSEWIQVGKDWMSGLVQGLVDHWNEYVLPALKAMAEEALKIWRIIWGERSPSKEMYESGVNAMRGWAMGLVDGAKEAFKKAKEIGIGLVGVLGGGDTSGMGQLLGTGTNQFLNPLGELMRETTKTTGDPCTSADSPAKCISDSIEDSIDKSIGGGGGGGGAIGKIGKAVTDAVGGAGSAVVETVGELAEEATHTLKTIAIDQANFTNKNRERTINAYTELQRNLEGNLKIARDNGKKILTTNRIAMDKVVVEQKNFINKNRERTESILDSTKGAVATASETMTKVGTIAMYDMEGVFVEAINAIHSVAAANGASTSSTTTTNTNSNNTTTNIYYGSPTPEQEISNLKQRNVGDIEAGLL